MRLSFTLCFAFLFLVDHLFAQDPYHARVLKDGPTALWTMDEVQPADNQKVVRNAIGDGLSAIVHGNVEFEEAGPRPSIYPDFSEKNLAARFSKGPNYLIVKDPGDESPLDFAIGDAMTLEAWVKIDQNLPQSYPYIIGKGRTLNPGTNPNNQSYSLRLAPQSGGAMISFFFMDERGTKLGTADAGHRWTSTKPVPEDGDWHHVAVTYEFGKADSLKGYIDGESVPGKWDLAGATDKAPLVDNDELWIGSSMAGRATLGAVLDEVAIYRKTLTAEQIRSHVTIKWEESPYSFTKVREDAPKDHVRVEIMEGVPAPRSWKFRPRTPELLYETDLFAMKELPRKYNGKGLIEDRQVPALLHMMTTVDLKAGDYEFIVRSLDAARLVIDGKIVAETGFLNLRSDAHQPYYELPDHGDDLLSIPAAHQEQRTTVSLDAGEHVISLYRLVGNKGRGCYLGELSVGMAPKGKSFAFLSPTRTVPYTDEGWITWRGEDRLRRRDWDQARRLELAEGERKYWAKRHEWAAKQVSAPKNLDIDQFVDAKLAEANLGKTPLTSDWEFLRRLTLDTIGTIPTPKQIDQFFAFDKETRRPQMIEVLLDDPSWADHWVTYWQDALAENPGLTKPELNNSGPFRWYLYEAFLDNKPFDQFVTELIMMEGDPYVGGPAGFSIASQNDVPMAAKAHIVGTAFQAVEMKCARCHDAPYHDVQQADLFEMAALLKRAPEKVPGSSSIPLSPEEVENLAVKVTLKPGTSVKPKWPFAEFVSVESDVLPESLYRNPNDSREQLAAHLTSPHNQRFADVLINRLWKRYLGRGLLDSVDDWEEATCSHPELLQALASDFVAHGYDLKHTARLILNSDVYQRQPVPELTATSGEAAFFQGPIRRKMTGEQIADSLYQAVDKSYGSEELTMDGDGKRSNKTFGHLGIPERSWQFVTVSNERDRPSMSLPVAQSVVDFMSAFGWRQQRQDPITDREDPLTALQPMALANGTAPLRAIDFSDDSALTAMSLQDQPVESFIEGLFERLLTRPPSSDERSMFVSLLKDGYEDRIVAGPEAVEPKRLFRTGITWSTHFDPKSDDEAMARMLEVIRGDKPSARLNADWRQRAEDAVWILVNSPEFVIVP